jgi:hypothetical protein
MVILFPFRGPLQDQFASQVFLPHEHSQGIGCIGMAGDAK